MTRSKDIIFLLGAGASVEAGIPVSAQMIDALEGLVEANGTSALYNHVKSSIFFSAGLRGKYHPHVNFNIETLANTLYELERNEEHPLYPFIASWSSRFVGLAGPNFEKICSFRRYILQLLKGWVCPEDSTRAEYYRGFISLQRDLNHTLHVFSLNYDLSVEHLATVDFRIETGFAGFGPRYPWDWQRFEAPENSNNPLPHMFLYKLHGSINWKRNKITKELFSVEQIQNIETDNMELIFGKEFKMEAADPYLFFAYQFRNLCYEARLVVIVGYGFGDSHINKMLTQSANADKTRRFLVVQRCAEIEVVAKQKEIAAILELDAADEQIFVLPGSAKAFLESDLLAAKLQSYLPPLEDPPF